MESDHKAPLCAERHCFMWSVCHEGKKSSSTLSLLYSYSYEVRRMHNNTESPSQHNK